MEIVRHLMAGCDQCLDQISGSNINADQLSIPSNATPIFLTKRQRDVFTALLAGMSNKAIGRQFGISHFTVRNHVSQVLQILGLPDRASVRREYADASSVRSASRQPVSKRFENLVQVSSDQLTTIAQLQLEIKDHIRSDQEIGFKITVGDISVRGTLVNENVSFPDLLRAMCAYVDQLQK